jgi:signal transduction histidine kinase
VLDTGLADALATLAAGAAIPVELEVDITVRPTPAIETMTYFCAAEVLANATKHSRATRVTIAVANRGPSRLTLRIHDDGIGGARLVRGGGLAGLLQRIGTVDGKMHLHSPPGGPTRISIFLPLRA